MTVDTASTSSNLPSQVSPSSPVPGKVVVAKSDFEHALKAIDMVMAGKLSQIDDNDNQSQKDDDKDMEVDVEMDDQKENNHENKSDSVKDAFFIQIQNSLKERLYQVAEPIHDEDFHKRYRGPLIQKQIDVENEEEAILQAEEDAILQAQEEAAKVLESDEKDYDEQELMDEEAQKRARELRVQVRELAVRMKQQQESVLQRAIRLAQREIRLLTEDILLDKTKSENEIEEESIAASAETNALRKKALKQMENSLQSLTDSLHRTVDDALPKSLFDLKETMQVIEKSLRRQGQTESLSQTEQAIVSKTNEGSNSNDHVYKKYSYSSTIDQENLDRRNLPDFRLADFLGAY